MNWDPHWAACARLPNPWICLRAAVAVGMLSVSAAGFAEFIPGYPDDFRNAYDPREVALLPHYCKYTQLYRQHIPGGNNPAEIKRMYATYGPGFHALHHYCWAIISTNRALFLAPTKQTKTFYFENAIRDIDFVIANSPKDFVLLPELLTEKSKNLIRLGRGSTAVGELLKAIALKADYWPPYLVLSNFYSERGEVRKAREVLEQGLAAAPDAKPLEKRLAELTQASGKPNASK